MEPTTETPIETPKPVRRVRKVVLSFLVDTVDEVGHTLDERLDGPQVSVLFKQGWVSQPQIEDLVRQVEAQMNGGS